MTLSKTWVLFPRKLARPLLQESKCEFWVKECDSHLCVEILRSDLECIKFENPVVSRQHFHFNPMNTVIFESALVTSATQVICCLTCCPSWESCPLCLWPSGLSVVTWPWSLSSIPLNLEAPSQWSYFLSQSLVSSVHFLLLWWKDFI